MVAFCSLRRSWLRVRGRPSHRKTGIKTSEKIVRVLSEEIYHDFGPTLASEYLANKHDIRIGREALRQVMISAGLWRARGQKVEAVHQWRERRSCRGELIQWDTSTHDWLEGRGETIYLIHMIDDATSELTARFVRHDSTQENMRVLRFYLERHGRPVAFYTDKASLFQTAVVTIEEANRYLDEEFMPWWNQYLVVTPAKPSDAHRPLDKTFDLNAILSVVETRQVTSDYTLRFQGKIYRIGRTDVRPGPRGGNVRIEVRSGGSIHARFQERYLAIEECQPQPRQQQPVWLKPPARHLPAKPSEASRKSISGISRSSGLPVWKAAPINKTRG
jgi:hypothetical protein